ncbi:G protein-coupled glucose receptor regulating Gpa2-domain-containing protein [Paramyrothecium foliicola]|nr:G protein-coupled glucose receptor regulating Gpa2-domain-containing protein [Paramyrothecium foliicola]
MAFDLVVASITFAGSAVSCIATGLVLTCFVIWRHNQTSFRHMLILSLTLSDFINSSVNVVSGAFYIRDKQLYDGAACTFSGWIAQLSVQATDFSILAISVATLLVVTQRARLVNLSTRASMAICFMVWLMPCITSTTAAAMGEIRPVSGNWCWISSERTDLRYGLTHGWRFAIIGITISIYSYIWWYLSKHFKSMTRFDITMETAKLRESVMINMKDSRDYIALGVENGLEHKPATHPFRQPADVDMTIWNKDLESQSYGYEVSALQYKSSLQHERPDTFTTTTTSCVPSESRTTTLNVESSQSTSSDTSNPAKDFIRSQSDKRYREIKRMLLLNGYPLLYVILWIPGIVNRVMEATGSQNTRVQNILQTSTQFVGFANAVTYGLNQHWQAGR